MNSKYSLDKTSKFIISEMMKDGRIKYTALAKKLNITPAAVKERVERLIDKKILRVSSMVNHQQYYPVTATIGIESDAQGIDKLTRRLRNCPLVFHISRTSGNYNLIVSLLAEDLDFIDDFLNRQIRSESGVKHVEVNIGTATVTPEYTPLRMFYPDDIEEAPCGLMADDERRCPRCPAFIKEEKK